MLPIDGNAVAASRPHHATAARNREGPVETRQSQPGEIAHDGFDGEVEAPTIGFPTRSFAEAKVGLALFKEDDERLGDSFEFARCSAALRIEHDCSGNGVWHFSGLMVTR